MKLRTNLLKNDRGSEWTVRANRFLNFAMGSFVVEGIFCSCRFSLLSISIQPPKTHGIKSGEYAGRAIRRMPFVPRRVSELEWHGRLSSTNTRLRNGFNATRVLRE